MRHAEDVLGDIAGRFRREQRNQFSGRCGCFDPEELIRETRAAVINRTIDFIARRSWWL